MTRQQSRTMKLAQELMDKLPKLSLTDAVRTSEVTLKIIREECKEAYIEGSKNSIKYESKSILDKKSENTFDKWADLKGY